MLFFFKSLSCLTGFLGTAKYDVAISTACPGLDYIVVETTGAAQACVELLRRKNLGVATFMILVYTRKLWLTDPAFNFLVMSFSSFLY